MNAPLRHAALDVDRFLLELDGEATIHATRDEVTHEIASTDFGRGRQPFRVTWFNAFEGWSRDVSDEFDTDDESNAEPFNGDYCHADHFQQLMRGA